VCFLILFVIGPVLVDLHPTLTVLLPSRFSVLQSILTFVDENRSSIYFVDMDGCGSCRIDCLSDSVSRTIENMANV
jgi:hypothetical protein